MTRASVFVTGSGMIRVPACPDRWSYGCIWQGPRPILEVRERTRGKTMIDWDSGDWGNRVTYAANGSWVVDKHGDDVTDQD